MNRGIFNPIPDERPFRHHDLPALDHRNQQIDHIYSVNTQPTMVRYINETAWCCFNTLLPAGTRILIRKNHFGENNFCYQLVATNNSFRRLIYIYAMDEMSPEHDMTSDEYFQQHPYVAPSKPTAAVPDNILHQWSADNP